MQTPFLIQGHRGARGLRPENTLPSFEAALDVGANSIELDVQLTSDGTAVVFHDDCIHEAICRLHPDAPTNVPAPETRPRLSELTYEQIRWYIADGNPDSNRFPNQSPEATPLTLSRNDVTHPYQIPRLASVFDFLGGYTSDIGDRFGKTDVQRDRAAAIITDVELKTTPFRHRVGDRVAQLLVDEATNIAGWGNRRIRSFDHRLVRRARHVDPAVGGIVLIEAMAPVDPVAIVQAADAEIYAPDYLFLDEEQVRQCHAAGVKVLPWTVNTPENWARLIAWGVDGITTDYPDRLAQWLAQPPASAK